MIDFISTRSDVDEQTAASAKLLTAVIVQAIKDASEANVLSADRHAAIEFLYSKTSMFPLYASLIGVDPDQIRNALLEPPPAIEPKSSLFDAMQRRRLKGAYLAWKAM